MVFSKKKCWIVSFGTDVGVVALVKVVGVVTVAKCRNCSFGKNVGIVVWRKWCNCSFGKIVGIIAVAKMLEL